MWTKVTLKNAKVGMVVKPNPKCWEWGMQGRDSNGKRLTGKIVTKPTKRHRWVNVKWENGTENGYQVGALNRYDLLTEVEEKPGVVCPGNVKVGLRVVRGPDWKWYNQDHVDNKPVAGVVVGVGGTEARWDGFTVPQGWCRVKWDNGSSNNYRIGQNANIAAGYDLYISPEVVKEKKPRKVVSLAMLAEKDDKIKVLEGLLADSQRKVSGLTDKNSLLERQYRATEEKLAQAKRVYDNLAMDYGRAAHQIQVERAKHKLMTDRLDTFKRAMGWDLK
jgi:hypothetical protein